MAERTATALDQGDIKATTKLFDEALRRWGAPGVRELMLSASAKETMDKGLDLFVAEDDPSTPIYGRDAIPDARVIQVPDTIDWLTGGVSKPV